MILRKERKDWESFAGTELCDLLCESKKIKTQSRVPAPQRPCFMLYKSSLRLRFRLILAGSISMSTNRQGVTPLFFLM